jgi:hypothetical protein
MANRGSNPASVIIQAFDSTGTPLGTAANLTIPVGAQAPPKLVSDLLGVNGTGWIKVTSDQPVVGAMLLGRYSAASLAALLGAAAGFTTLYFPHFDQGNEWWTGVTLANPSSSAASVTVQAFDTAGTPLGTAANLNVPAGAQAPPKLVSDLLGVNGTGWIQVTSTQPVVGAMVIGRWHDASMDALPAQGSLGGEYFGTYY